MTAEAGEAKTPRRNHIRTHPEGPKRVSRNRSPAVSGRNSLRSCARVIASKNRNPIITLMRAIPSGATMLCGKTYFVTVGTVQSSRTALRREKNGSMEGVSPDESFDSLGSVALN